MSAFLSHQGTSYLLILISDVITESSNFDSKITITAAVVNLAICLSLSNLPTYYWYWGEENVVLHAEKYPICHDLIAGGYEKSLD